MNLESLIMMLVTMGLAAGALFVFFIVLDASVDVSSYKADFVCTEKFDGKLEDYFGINHCYICTDDSCKSYIIINIDGDWKKVERNG